LFHANSLIRFRERTIVHEKIIHFIASKVRNDSTEKRFEIAVVIEKNLLSNSFVVAIVEMQDILDICESKDVDVYLLNLRSLIMFDSSFIVDVAFASESNEISSEYLEFSDVFFENEVRQLSKHESHDLSERYLCQDRQDASNNKRSEVDLSSIRKIQSRNKNYVNIMT
jgi:hypothetical protein